MLASPPRTAFLLLLAACFWLRLHYGQGLAFADDFNYVSAALDANEQGWLPFIKGISNIYANRLSVVLPLAVFQAVFGRNELSLELLGLSFSCASVGITFLIALRLHGEWAALLVATIPQEIWYGTSLLPDSVTPFYMGAALYGALRAQDRLLDARAFAWYALAAFFTFCTFEARATGGVVLLALGLWGLMQPDRPIVRAALPGVLFFAIVAGTWGLFGVLTGDYRIQLRQLVHDGTGTHWTRHRQALSTSILHVAGGSACDQRPCAHTSACRAVSERSGTLRSEHLHRLSLLSCPPSNSR